MPRLGPAKNSTREEVQNGASLIPFAETEKSLGSLNTSIVARLLAAASDITLIIDAQGTICDVNASSDTLPHPENWIGSKWLDTVTVESRVKIDDLLKEARGGETARARQINHRVTGQPDLPVRYSVVALGKGRFAALGTELRPLAQLQQRLVEAQRSTETEFLRLRSAETRFRILFQTAAEAVLMADANTLKTIDVNPAAATLVEMTSAPSAKFSKMKRAPASSRSSSPCAISAASNPCACACPIAANAGCQLRSSVKMIQRKCSSA